MVRDTKDATVSIDDRLQDVRVSEINIFVILPVMVAEVAKIVVS